MKRAFSRLSVTVLTVSIVSLIILVSMKSNSAETSERTRIYNLKEYLLIEHIGTEQLPARSVYRPARTKEDQIMFMNVSPEELDIWIYKFIKVSHLLSMHMISIDYKLPSYAIC